MGGCRRVDLEADPGRSREPHHDITVNDIRARIAVGGPQLVEPRAYTEALTRADSRIAHLESYHRVAAQHRQRAAVAAERDPGSALRRAILTPARVARRRYGTAQCRARHAQPRRTDLIAAVCRAALRRHGRCCTQPDVTLDLGERSAV